jgi:hypothetical protein
MFLQRFTIIDSKGNKSTGGITISDAIHNIVNIGIAALLGFFAYFAFIFHKGKKEIKKYDDIINSEQLARTDINVRTKLIESRLRHEYGKSWKVLVETNLKNHIEAILYSLLDSQVALNTGKISEEQANLNFRHDMHNFYKSHDFLKLSDTFWRYIFHNLGFIWLNNPFYGWDITKDGKVVFLSKPDGSGEYEKFVEELLSPMLGYGGQNNGVFSKDMGAAAYDLAVIWMFDNHERVLNEVVKDFISKHPEYKEVCPIKF